MPLKKSWMTVKNRKPARRLASVKVSRWMWVRRNRVAVMMATIPVCIEQGEIRQGLGFRVLGGQADDCNTQSLVKTTFIMPISSDGVTLELVDGHA